MPGRGPKRALAVISRCISTGRVIVLEHFVRRLDKRGLFWSDVLAVLSTPTRIRPDGFDDWGRERWIIRGRSADLGDVEIVCVLGTNERGEVTVFVTLFWED